MLTGIDPRMTPDRRVGALGATASPSRFRTPRPPHPLPAPCGIARTPRHFDGKNGKFVPVMTGGPDRIVPGSAVFSADPESGRRDTTGTPDSYHGPRPDHRM